MTAADDHALAIQHVTQHSAAGEWPFQMDRRHALPD